MSAGAPKLICILGIGRTGTNHLLTMLSQVPQIETRFEIFNPVPPYPMTNEELTALSRLSGVNFDLTPEDPEVWNTIRSRPDLVLDCLRRSVRLEKRMLVFKLFYGHLPAAMVVRHILSQPDVGVLFVRRRPIDVFISASKARMLKTWRSIDTTDLKVEITADAFLRWWSMRANWYCTLERVCWRNRMPFEHVTYETDLDQPPAETLRILLGMLKRLGVTGLTMPETGVIAKLARQDRETDVARKVTNWSAFERDLRGRDAFDAAFQHFPHYRPGPWKRLRRFLST